MTGGLAARMSAVKNLRIPLAARAGEAVNRLLHSNEKDHLVERSWPRTNLVTWPTTPCVSASC